MFYKLLIKILAKKYKHEAELILYMASVKEVLKTCKKTGCLNPPSCRLLSTARAYGILKDGMTTEQIIKEIIIKEIKREGGKE